SAERCSASRQLPRALCSATCHGSNGYGADRADASVSRKSGSASAVLPSAVSTSPRVWAKRFRTVQGLTDREEIVPVNTPPITPALPQPPQCDDLVSQSLQTGRPTSVQNSRQVIEKIGGASRARTDDLIVANDALSQLSYSPARWRVYFFDFTSRSAISPRQLMLK